MRNDRIIAVAQASVHFASTKELTELEPLVMQQLDEFFINYQKVRDVEVSVMGHKGSAQARQTLRRASTHKARSQDQALKKQHSTRWMPVGRRTTSCSDRRRAEFRFG